MSTRIYNKTEKKFEKDAREVAIANFEDILSTYFVSSRAVCDRLPNFERNVQKIRKEIEKTCDRKKFCFDFPVEGIVLFRLD